MVQRRVIVVPYDPQWEQMFLEEAEQLKEIFRDEIITIYHMGSTSIKGISAKPIIDIMPVVRDIERVQLFEAALAELGYKSMGEMGISGRRFFLKPSDDFRTHHVHFYEQGNVEINRHLAFRNYLRTHPLEAKEYSDLKEDLARRFPEDILSYIQGKDAFIKEIDRRASLINDNAK